MRGLLMPLLALLAGCGSTVPNIIREAPANAPPVSAVRADVLRFTGTRVRWGGTIVGTEPREDGTWLEIVQRHLGQDGRPYEDDRSQGRFLILYPGFVDPVDYAAGRSLTVVGVLDGQVQRAVGDYPYSFPVIRAEYLYLWEPLPSRYDSDPYTWDPWYYDPWYPRYRYRDPFYWHYPLHYRYLYPYRYYWPYKGVPRHRHPIKAPK